MPDDRKTASGYDVTFKAFVEADPYHPEQLVDALTVIESVGQVLRSELGVPVTVTKAYRAKKAISTTDEAEPVGPEAAES